jgi:hypothetical protein
LVNVEEERIPKNPENFQKTSSGVVYKNPKVFLNLYVLFISNKSDYEESLKNLSYIIQFFQSSNVFDGIRNPNLDPRIEKLISDLISMNFEQMNHLWGMLGGKYVPSVLYKVRTIAVDEGLQDGSGEFIKEIVTGAVDITR